MFSLDHTIRAASEADLPTLLAALAWAIDWRDARPPGGPAVRIETTDHGYVLEGWGREGDTAVVACVGGRAVGAAWYRFWTADTHSYGYVDPETPELGIGVDPAVRGAGVGTALLRRLLEEAHASGVEALSLSVEQENFAFGWYLRLGFERYAQVADSWTMVKRLGSEVRAPRDERESPPRTAPGQR